MSEELLYASYPVFRVSAVQAAPDRELAAKQLEELFAEWDGRVRVRGAYSTAAFTAEADLMFWWVAESVDDLQQLTIEFRRTHLGSLCTPVHSFLGVVQPAEFAKDHLPAFVKGEPPKRYACVYPFVRTPVKKGVSSFVYRRARVPRRWRISSTIRSTRSDSKARIHS